MEIVSSIPSVEVDCVIQSALTGRAVYLMFKLLSCYGSFSTTVLPDEPS